ncbi:MAG: biopolymer transporter ExbD [Acidobacteria bacterium]|nr:biopolymer transporter ExbD [Acidobacteriota bacterium]
MAMGGSVKRGALNADINETPLVDVMLVLLIIMMLVAPMLQKGVDVKLPEAANTADKPDTQEQTVVAVDANKRMYVNGIQVADQDFLSRVQSVLEEKKERIVLIKGDENAPYSSIMQAMDDLRRAGIEDIGLITERKMRPGETAGGK